MKRTRILLADDHSMICAGFQKLPEPEFEVVGTVSDGRSLLTAAEELKPASRPRQLTPRQREIAQLLAEGRSAKEIASILDISIRTVHFHKYEIMKELGLASNAELVQYAIKHSLIPPP
jgi:DNA-binding NarL/FixJ family response regulator